MSKKKFDGRKSLSKPGGADTVNKAKKDKTADSSDQDSKETADSDANVEESSDDEEDSDDEQDSETGCKLWLEVLPSKGGTLLVALLADIMTEGLTPDQENILGNFIASVGALILYKAARDQG